MYINTFKYTPKDVSCQLCTEYVKKLGCTALRCPWLAERIEASVVGYREAVMETFPRDRRLSSRLNLLIKHYPGSLWSNEQHERRMQYQCAVQGYRRRRDTNAYYAAMYLLTSNDDIYRRTANCFCKDGIEFGYCRAVYDAGFSPICPTLFLPLFLRDEIPQEHKDGIDMAREHLRRARVLVVCGSIVDESVKNDIAVAERLRITATTLDGILTVKGQGRRNE